MWRTSPVDGLPELTEADPDCDVCKGHGIVDVTPDGFYLMPMFDRCPQCCPEPINYQI